MSFSRRNFLFLSGGIAAAAGVTACGSDTGMDSSSDSGASGGAGGNVALSQWYHEYGEEGVEAAVKSYADDYKNATVTVKWNPGNYDTLIPTTLLTNDVPDVFEYGNGPTLDMIQQGQVVDLTDTLGDAVSKFNPSVMKRLTFQDKVWAIPQTVDMQLLYYRKSMLDKAAVEPPKTMTGLVEAAKAAKAAGMGGFFAGNDGGVGVLANMLIWSSGLEQLNEERTQAGFLEPEFYAAISAYRDFFNSGSLVQSASAEWYDAAAFINGEAGLQWGGLWSLTQVREALGDDFGVLPFPKIGDSGRESVPFGAFSSCVTAKGKNVDAAKQFVKWLWVDQTDKQVDFSNSYGTHIPAQPDLVPQASKLSEGAGKDAATFVQNSGFASDIMWTGPLGDAFNAAVINVVKRNADPQKEFAAVGTKAKAELKRVNG